MIGRLITKARRHAAKGLVSAAALIAALQIILPPMFDLLFDALLIGMVWLAARIGGTPSAD